MAEGKFEDYNEYEKQMYVDYALSCAKNGIFSHWYPDGRYIHHWNRHTYQQDIWDKAEREQVVWLQWKKHMKEREEEESNERNKLHNRPWYHQDVRAENHRVAEEKKQREIAAAIDFLASNGIETVRR